jgi:uncharacterized membrane protein
MSEHNLINENQPMFPSKDNKKLIFIYVLLLLVYIIPLLFIVYIIMINLMKNDGGYYYRQQAHWLARTVNIAVVIFLLLVVVALLGMASGIHVLMFAAGIAFIPVAIWQIYREIRALYCYIIEKPLPDNLDY